LQIDQIVNRDIKSIKGKVSASLNGKSNTRGLTKRQLDVLALIAKGYTNKHISNILNISLNTVKEHIRNIFLFLNVNTRGQCVVKSQSLGLIDVEHNLVQQTHID